SAMHIWWRIRLVDGHALRARQIALEERGDLAPIPDRVMRVARKKMRTLPSQRARIRLSSAAGIRSAPAFGGLRALGAASSSACRRRVALPRAAAGERRFETVSCPNHPRSQPTRGDRLKPGLGCELLPRGGEVTPIATVFDTDHVGIRAGQD